MSSSSTSVADSPVVIEAAISAVIANTQGATSSSEAIIGQAIECIDAGAGIVHYHHDFAQSDEESIAQCVQVQTRILGARPGTLIYPGYLKGDKPELRMLRHLPALHEAGALNMFAFDPGLSCHGRSDADGLPSTSITGGTTFSEAADMVAYARKMQVPCSVGIFEPGALRWVKAYGAAGRFVPGTLVKFYFAGEQAWGAKGTGVTFGLPPTKAALDIYLKLIEGSGLPWIVSILGGCLLDSELPRYVLERGGHLRVGLEDPLRPLEATNAELVRAAVELAREVGRPVARHTEALATLSRSASVVGQRRAA